MGRLEKLKELEARLYTSLNDADEKNLPALAKQYRDTLKEIEDIEGGADDGDEIAEILAGREADGKPGAVRKNRARM